VWLKWNETRYLQVSAVTSDWFALAQGRSCVDVRRFFTSLRMVFTSSNSFTFFLLTSLNSLVTTPVTSSSVEAPHDSVSSTVDCASDSDDNRIIDRQITTARKAKLYDLDMLLNCSLTSTGHGSFWLYIWHTAEALRMACSHCIAASANFVNMSKQLHVQAPTEWGSQIYVLFFKYVGQILPRTAVLSKPESIPCVTSLGPVKANLMSPT